MYEKMQMVPINTGYGRNHLFTAWLLSGCRNNQDVMDNTFHNYDFNGDFLLYHDEYNV